MIRRFASSLLLVAVLAAQSPADDPLLRAMKDELARSSKISLNNLETPYFIEYTMEDASMFATSASLGAVIGVTETRVRLPRVKVRVGDYNFDNANYMYSDLTSGVRYDPDQFSLDNNYAAHRHGWWLATDRAYKGAVEAIARKRAALKNINQQEPLPDLWKAPASQHVEPLGTAPSMKGWTDRVRSLSTAFAHPEILQSNVSFSSSYSNFYMLNSEGTVLRRPEPLVHIRAEAVGHAPDGSPVRDSVSIPRVTEGAMPNEAALKSIVASVAGNVRALSNAAVGESYSGPVLFEGVAGAQVMAEVLAPNFSLGRRPVSEPGRQAPFLPSEFEGRLESRVLPEFLDVVDDPSQKAWNGQELLGHLEIDEEGVAAKPLTLVEQGRLKSFLLTRQPVKGFEGSNGRARMPGPYGARSASISNLFIRNSQPVKAGDLKARLMKLLADRNKPWGIIVRKMDFPSAAPSDEVRRLAMAASQSGAVRLVSAPILAYKVYADGREELVRGLRFRGLNTRALRDIAAASEEMYALHYLNNMAPMALVSAGGYVAPVSVIGPALLFDELELEKPRDELQKPPVVPPPPLTAPAR